ncbi:FMRFamide-like neuropeptide 6 [Toxocara canis]|uniref:FMRFamide-like neuropeptide 6 n=1 Tax=Toxocara canis TaxID=6265 RepID=A0A0B2VYJ9_TOXCA|nr:FMRFamide-like neuropeptide 6 [Toxocara canis]
MSTSIGEQFCKEYAHLHLCRLQDNLEGALAEIQYLVNSDVAAPVTSVINKRKSAFVRFGKRPNNEEDDEKEVEKRKSAFVRFGRSGSEKRKSSYIRFG